MQKYTTLCKQIKPGANIFHKLQESTSKLPGKHFFWECPRELLGHQWESTRKALEKNKESIPGTYWKKIWKVKCNLKCKQRALGKYAKKI